MNTNRKALVVIVAMIFYVESALAEYQFKVGVSLPLTGPVAEYGVATQNGIKLASEQDSKAFENIEFLFENNEYSAATAVTAFNKLSRIDGVDLVYNWGETTLHAVAPLASARRSPVLAMSLDSRPARGQEYVVRTINHSDEYADAMLAHLVSKQAKRIVLIAADDPYFTSLIEAYQRHLKPRQAIIHVSRVLPEDHDFRSLITKLGKLDIDAIGVLLFPGQVSAFFKQAEQMKLSGIKFGTDIFESKTEIRDARGAMQASVYPNVVVPQGFASAYRKRFRNENQIAFAYNAYCMAKMLAQKFGMLNTKPSNAEILNTLKSAESEKAYRFTNTARGGNYYKFDIAIMRIDGGGFERYAS